MVEDVFLLDDKAEELAAEVVEKFNGHLKNVDFCGIDGRIQLDGHDKIDTSGAFSKFNDCVCKVVYSVDTPETARKISAYLKAGYEDTYEIRLAWETGVEFWCKGAGKEEMIRRLRKKFDDVHTVICAGDYENDVFMLMEADISYAPSNACEEAKAVADVVGVSCAEGLIHQIVTDLEKRIR